MAKLLIYSELTLELDYSDSKVRVLKVFLKTKTLYMISYVNCW